LRVLAYDRNLAGRSGDTVRVAVLYRAGDAASERGASELIAAAGAAERLGSDLTAGLVSLPPAPTTPTWTRSP